MEASCIGKGSSHICLPWFFFTLCTLQPCWKQRSRWALDRDHCSSSCLLRKKSFVSFSFFLPRMFTRSQCLSLNESEFLPGIQPEMIQEMQSPVSPFDKVTTAVQRGGLCCLWERGENRIQGSCPH